MTAAYSLQVELVPRAAFGRLLLFKFRKFAPDEWLLIGCDFNREAESHGCGAGQRTSNISPILIAPFK